MLCIPLSNISSENRHKEKGTGLPSVDIITELIQYELKHSACSGHLKESLEISRNKPSATKLDHHSCYD